MGSNMAQQNDRPFRTFQVRDISHLHGNRPCFDIVFHDDENSCERYSESVWDTHEAAELVANHMEHNGSRPCHWDVLRKKA